jgi:hypothetical protein
VEHVVFFPGPDGSPAFRRVASLDDAVAWVERLHNVDALTEFSVHALSEVPLSVRAVYKVEATIPTVAAAAPTEAPAALAAPDTTASAAEDEDAVAASDAAGSPDDTDVSVGVEAGPARKRGLGFFTN